MPKKRVVTSTKPMRFVTTYGTERSKARQEHAEEREAKRWLQTRLNNARILAEKYQLDAVAGITDVAASVKGRDLMAMKPDTVCVWTYEYDNMIVSLAVKRLP
jgi:hypothetical protein